MATTPTLISEAELLQELLEAAHLLLTQEVDTYEEQISPTGEVIHKKTGKSRIITAANLQAANSVINSKAAQKHFAEQRRGLTVNVRKRLQQERQPQIEVLDE